MATNVDDLLGKQNNPEQQERTKDIPASQKLSAEEFVRLVQAVKENQSSVKTIEMNGSDFTPDAQGKVVLSTADSDQMYLQICNASGTVTNQFTQTYISGNSKEVYFKVVNTIDQGGMPIPSSQWQIVLKINNRTIKTIIPSAGDASDHLYSTGDISQYLTNIASTTDAMVLTLSRTTQSSTKTPLDVSVSLVCVTCRLITQNSIANVDPAVIRYNAEFSTQSATLVARFYGVTASADEGNYIEDDSTVLSLSGAANVSVPNSLLAGAHKVVAFLRLPDGTVSDTVTTQFFVSTGATQGTAYVTIDQPRDENRNLFTPQQNGYAYIDFAVFTQGLGESDSCIALLQRLEANGTFTTLATRTVTNQAVSTWQYLVPFTSNTIRIVVPFLDGEGNIRYDGSGGVLINAMAQMTFSATPSAINWRQADDEAVYLTAQGRTNQDANVDTWANGVAHMEFHDVNFTDGGSGWVNQNAIRLIGTSKATLRGITPYYDTTAFASGVRGGGILATGRTVKMAFKVSNVSDPSQKVIECYEQDSDIGFYVTGNAIYVAAGLRLTSDPNESQTVTGHNDRRFASDVRIDLTIVTQSYYDQNRMETKHETRYYVNGELGGFGVVNGTSISQLSPKNIVFGGEGAVLDLYDVRIYNKALTAYEVKQTSTMDKDSAMEIESDFKKNQNYQIDGSGNPVITLEKQLAYGKWLVENDYPEQATFVVSDAMDWSIGSTSNNRSDLPQLFAVYHFRKNPTTGKGEIDPIRTVLYEGDAGRLRIRRQGTSTATSTYGNIRLDARGVLRKHAWDDQTQAFSTEYTEVSNLAFKVNNTDDKPCKVVTIKKNPNESTQARNLPISKMYEDFARYLAGASDDYTSLLTPPQQAELATIRSNNPSLTKAEAVARIRTRQCIDGIPAVGFTITKTDPTSASYQFTNITSEQFQKGEFTSANTYFCGQFDIITDKTNQDVFGFGLLLEDGENGDFSYEFRENSSALLNFHSTDMTNCGQKMDNDVSQNGLKLLDSRYPSNDDLQNRNAIGLEDNGAMQRIFDFVYNCSPHKIGSKSENGVLSSTNGQITILGVTATDSAASRREKFRQELYQYMVVPQVIYNGLFIDVMMLIDQDVKNQFFTHFTTENATDHNGHTHPILRLLAYDMDSGARVDNDNFFRFLPYIKYTDTDIYDGKEGGRGSDLWELVFACFQTEMKQMARLLAKSGLLTREGLGRYFFTQQMDTYNAITYNANSEYSYTKQTTDYAKSHGSAKEDLEWLVRERLFFFGGKTFLDNEDGTEYVGTSVTSWNVSNYTNLDAGNKANSDNKNFFVKVSSYVRNFAYLRIDTRIVDGSEMVGYDDQSAQAILDVQNGIPREATLTPDTQVQGANDRRFYLYGSRNIRSIGDLSHHYISQVQNWGELLNVQELILGSTEVFTVNGVDYPYKNEILTNLNLPTNGMFGSCKKLILANCTGFSGSVSLIKFPVLREFDGRGQHSVTSYEFPTGNALTTLRLPANLTSLNLTNKPNITTFSFEGSSNLTSITCVNCSDLAATKCLDMLNALLS